MEDNLKEVSKSEFYNYVGSLDAIIRIVGDYPYIAEYRMRNSRLLKGRSVDSIDIEGEELIITKFFIS